MASLIRHPKGLYFVQFYDASRRPKRKRLSLKTRNRRTAERLLARLEAEYLLGEYDPWAPAPSADDEGQSGEPDLRSLGRAVEAYMADRAHLAPETIRTYRSVFHLFRDRLGPDRPVGQLGPDDVLAFLDSTEAGPVTRKKYVAHLGYLFRWLVERGAMEGDVSKDVRLPRLPEQAPKAMTVEQVEAFVDTARDHSKGRGADWRLGDYAWLADLVWANVHLGLRLSEVCHLRWESVDLEARTLAVRNTETFTAKRGKERVVPVPAPAHEVLVRLAGVRGEGGGAGEPWVFVPHFGGRLKRHYLSQAFLKFRRLAGLPDGVSFHSTRHTYATWLAGRGVPVGVLKELLGHASITTTERYMSVRPATSELWVSRAFG